jgi:hypothetical protein
MSTHAAGYIADVAYIPGFYPNMAPVAMRYVDGLAYHMAKPGVTLPYKANLGVVTSTVQEPVYERLLGLLGARSMRLSEIVAAPEMRDTQPAGTRRQLIADACDAFITKSLPQLARLGIVTYRA